MCDGRRNNSTHQGHITRFRNRLIANTGCASETGSLCPHPTEKSHRSRRKIVKPVDSAIVAAAVALVSLFAATPSVAGSPEIELQLLVSGLDQPVVMTHANDGSGRLFIVEQDGAIRIWDGSQLLATPFLDIDPQVTSGGEKGLLGLAFHPDYASNGWFFVYYSGPDPESDPGVDHNTVVSRFSVQGGNPNQADPASETEIFRYEQPWSNHNGGQIAFGPDGFLYIGLGDGGLGGDTLNAGQRVDTLLGKILRIDIDGSLPYEIPADNPFVGEVGLDEIWAFGLRNPWRFSFDLNSGDLFIGDVGQNAWEEIDYQPASSSGGENYGWRCYEGDTLTTHRGAGRSRTTWLPSLNIPTPKAAPSPGDFGIGAPNFPISPEPTCTAITAAGSSGEAPTTAACGRVSLCSTPTGTSAPLVRTRTAARRDRSRLQQRSGLPHHRHLAHRQCFWRRLRIGRYHVVVGHPELTSSD